jgi:lysophospholipase L1-like esterase
VRRCGRLVVAAALVLLAGCAGQPTGPLTGTSAVPAAPDGPAIVDVAIGASETVGAGVDDGSRLRSAWPQVLYTSALPRGAVFYNFGIPGATVAEALTAELPQALAVRPDLVTVWLNVNDLLVGVPAAQYESRLGQLVHALRRGGHTRVLVANTPWLDRLEAYLACLPDAPLTAAPCGLPGGSVPPPAEVNALVDSYNDAIARVVAREGADLVDLHAAGEVPLLHPEYISSDGFHPSEKGHVAVAQLFAAVLRRGHVGG